MARKLSVVIFITLISMLLLLVENNAADNIEAPTPQREASKKKIPMYGSTEECEGRCTTRCSKMAYKKPCMFFCQKCYAKCLCVPPGTYGYKPFCPCYNDWKANRGGPKCP